MLKKMMLIAVTCFTLLMCVSCGNGNIKDKESVSVKTSDLYKDYHLDEASLFKKVDFETGGVRVVFNNISYEDVVTKFNFYMKNSTEKPVKVVSTDLSINGLMCTDSIMTDLEPGSEKECFIEISNEWFAEMNIKTIKNIEYIVRVLDEKHDELAKSDVLRADTNAQKGYEQQYDNDGFVVYNKDGIVFLARELGKSKLSDDMELSFYLENNTNKPFSVMTTEVYVNGKRTEPVFVMTVGANKKAVDTMLFYEKDLKALGIKEFEKIEVSFKAISDNLEPVFETEKIEIPVK